MDWRECTKHNIQTLKNGYKDIIYEKCPVCKLQAENDRLGLIIAGNKEYDEGYYYGSLAGKKRVDKLKAERDRLKKALEEITHKYEMTIHSEFGGTSMLDDLLKPAVKARQALSEVE